MSIKAEALALLHEGRISKREAIERIDSVRVPWEPEPDDWWSRPADGPARCWCCGNSFLLSTLLAVRTPDGVRTLYCSDCVDNEPVVLIPSVDRV